MNQSHKGYSPRFTGSAALELAQTGAKYALATTCVNVRQGIAIALAAI